MRRSATIIAGILLLVTLAGGAWLALRSAPDTDDPYKNLPVVNVGGTVVEVKGSTVILSVRKVDGTARQVRATLQASTTIQRIVAKEPTDGDPLPFERRGATLTDLVPGVTVLVRVPEATEVDAPAITAVKIEILP